MKRKKIALKKDSKKENKLIIIFLAGIILTFISFFIDNIFTNFIASIRLNILNGFFSAITYLGNFEIFVMIAVIITVFFLIYKKPIICFWCSIIGSFLFGILIKYIIARARPYEVLNISNLVPATLSSFPSGHTIAVFCVLPFLSKAFPKPKIIFWTLAVLVGFSRIYLGVHYLSDVIAGAFIGYLFGELCLFVQEKHKLK
jgi:undecaprenyl-diphosphatase